MRFLVVLVAVLVLVLALALKYSAALNRFIMPGAAEEPMADSPWYGFDFGPVHFTVMSTEHNFSVGSKQVPANPLLFAVRKPDRRNRKRLKYLFHVSR